MIIYIIRTDYKRRSNAHLDDLAPEEEKKDYKTKDSKVECKLFILLIKRNYTRSYPK